MSPPVLAGYDGSEGGLDALVLAALLALASDAKLTVASIFRFDASMPQEERDRRRRVAVRQAASGLGKVVGAPLDIRATAAGGPSPAGGLLALAGELGAELIAVGQSHRGAVGRVLPGGTGERLLALSGRPVALPPRGFARARTKAALLRPPWLARIGVAYDGWQESYTALRFASSLARRSGAQLQLLMVANPRSITAVAPFPADLDAVLLGHHEAAEASLRDLLERLPEVPPVSGEVLDGEPGAALGDATERRGLDLFVVGCRDRGPLGRLLPGSVSRRLVHSAACPLIVVPSRHEISRFRVADLTRPRVAPVRGTMRQTTL